MHVVATAGHVDHGKSTLVRALTGMEPDRWAEERRRGMTIDLGYAWTGLPSGATVAFVDVPGHQRFIGNMLAGLGPAPAVLVVVAADEGWRRQSAEHLAAVDALGISRGLLAVTRSDLADPAPALAEARERLAGSSLGAVEGVAVSGATGEGLPELRGALDRLLGALPPPDLAAPARLWVDRAFTVRGSGTVVTGTLGSGVLRTGDALELDGRAVRVRGLQRLGVAADEVASVARVAVNLRGVERAEVSRGQLLCAAGAGRTTDAVDVRLSATEGLAGDLVLHVGSAAVPARVRPLGGDVVRLSLARPVALRAGDRALLRDPGLQSVASGVLVLDADPPALRRRGAAAARAGALAGGVPDLAAEVARRGAVRRDALDALGVGGDEAQVRVVGNWLVDPQAWARWAQALADAVDACDPTEPGLPHEAARRAVGLPDAALLAPLVADAGLESAAGRVRRPGAVPVLAPGVQVLVERLGESTFDAPEQADLDALRLGPRELAAAETAGVLLRVGPGVVLRPDGPARAVRALAGLPQPFTLSAARQALGTTRRVAVPLLELTDARGWTRRLDGNLREVVR